MAGSDKPPDLFHVLTFPGHSQYNDVVPFTKEQRKAWATVRHGNRIDQAKAMLGGKCINCGATDQLCFITKEGEERGFKIQGSPKAWWLPEAEFFVEVKKKELWCTPCHNQSRIVHGVGRYNRGCRCEVCRQARREEYQRWKARGANITRNQRRNAKYRVAHPGVAVVVEVVEPSKPIKVKPIRAKYIPAQVVWYSPRQHSR